MIRHFSSNKKRKRERVLPAACGKEEGRKKFLIGVGR